ncbi:hypothetical protein Csa_004072 [Cucumis sativus]|uniref:ALOG domain-containing protein n=1 Tax=Cucumis sativus TaxID=3659 RepID=A0A0A0KNK5_CUCSA|nr:hypothetical protein Csa_004072 [Cucumis sativus]
MLGERAICEGSSSGLAITADQQQQQQQAGQAQAGTGAGVPLSRYESQKRRDWNTFGQYLKNQTPPVSLSHCNCNHVLEFLRYLDQFGKTRVHSHGCVFFGQPDPPAPCPCPLKQAWGSLDALIGRLRAAYEEHGGSPEGNPFGNGAIRTYLREVKESQAKARGIPYKKKKKKRNNQMMMMNNTNKQQQLLQQLPNDNNDTNAPLTHIP